MNSTLCEVEDKLEKLNRLRSQIREESGKHQHNSNVGWWLTMVGAPNGTAVAVTEANEVREAQEMLQKIDKAITMLEVQRLILQEQATPRKHAGNV